MTAILVKSPVRMSPSMTEGGEGIARQLSESDGRIAEHGTHDELMVAGGRYAELFTMQAAPYLSLGPT